MKNAPNCMVLNSCGIQIKVMPVLPSENIVSWSRFAEKGCLDSTASCKLPRPLSASGLAAAFSIN